MFTPWFELITKKALLNWWEQLREGKLTDLKKGSSEILRL